MSDWETNVKPILYLITIYIVLGVFITSIGTTVYYGISENDTFSEYDTHQIQIQNNAPFTFPYVNPTFRLYLKTTNDTECFIGDAKAERSCEDTPINLGYIPVGDPKSIRVTLISNGDNFSIMTNIDQDYLLFQLHAENNTLNCVNQGNTMYICK